MKTTKFILSILSVFFCLSAFGTTDNSNLILHYRFDSTDNNTSSVIKDSSPTQQHGELKGYGAIVTHGELKLPGGASGSSAAYVELPRGMFDNRDTLTISIWLKNETGAGNYAAMFFGTTESHPSQYWLLNPCNSSKRFKSVITNSVINDAPWNSEYGFSSSVSNQGVLGPITNNEWHLYTTVITPANITAYYDDTKVGTVAISRKVSDFGTGLVAYIGKSSYNDIFYCGSVRNVKIYAKALSEEEIKKEYFTSLLENDLNKITLEPAIISENITLPENGDNGSTIIWASSDIATITEKGTVKQHASKDRKVMLTATAISGEYAAVKTFSLTVYAATTEKTLQYYADKLELGIGYVTEDISLPVSDNENINITWTSSDQGLINESGKVTRSSLGSGDKPVQLTARIESKGVALEKKFDVVVAEADYGYLLSYIQTGGTERKSCFHIAGSTNGTTYTELNNGKAVVYPLSGSKKMNTPLLFRKPDGSFGLIASDNNASSSVMIFHSRDLIEYKDEVLLRLNENGITVSKPVCTYDNLQLAYIICWQGNNGKKYASVTKDLRTILETNEISSYSIPEVSGTFPSGTIQAGRIALTQKEYEKVIRKYGKIINTGISGLTDIQIQQGNQFRLPEKATAQYSDGSTKDFAVVWNQKDLDEIDIDIVGSYTINGIIQQPEYVAPLIRQRADPWIIKGDDGYYYFTASYPMHAQNDPEGYDRVILRRATTIEGLADAEEITIWDEKNCSSCYRYVWAPEIHFINGNWFVFFTTSVDSSVWSIRPRIISCSLGDKNPYDPDCWEDTGYLMETYFGDNVSFSNFSLDMTYFENKGKHYVVWAQTIGHSSLAIASVDGDKPWQTTSVYSLLTSPEYAWEWDNEWVNEGAAIIKNNGKIYLAFSASSVNHTYCVGLLYADEDADLLDAESWTKVRYPVLSTEDLPETQNGPGHNSFTIDEYGNAVIVYHARNPEETIDGGLYDPGRHAFAKSVNFAFDGTPVLNMTMEQELIPENKNVSIKIIIDPNR